MHWAQRDGTYSGEVFVGKQRNGGYISVTAAHALEYVGVKIAMVEGEAV